jgi:hypothetical protein
MPDTAIGTGVVNIAILRSGQGQDQRWPGSGLVSATPRRLWQNLRAGPQLRRILEDVCWVHTRRAFLVNLTENARR